MFRKSLKLSIAVVVIASSMMVLCGEGYAAAPTVKLVVNPDKTDVYARSEPVALTAETTGSGLAFKWELQGPGKIEGKGPEISYIVPETIKEASAQATITVTVIDEAGQETTETVTFNILAKEESPKPTKTRIVTALSNFLRRWIWFLIPALVAVGYAIKKYYAAIEHVH